MTEIETIEQYKDYLNDTLPAYLAALGFSERLITLLIELKRDRANISNNVDMLISELELDTFTELLETVPTLAIVRELASYLFLDLAGKVPHPQTDPTAKYLYEYAVDLYEVIDGVFMLFGAYFEKFPQRGGELIYEANAFILCADANSEFLWFNCLEHLKFARSFLHRKGGHRYRSSLKFLNRTLKKASEIEYEY